MELEFPKLKFLIPSFFFSFFFFDKQQININIKITNFFHLFLIKIVNNFLNLFLIKIIHYFLYKLFLAFYIKLFMFSII